MPRPQRLVSNDRAGEILEVVDVLGIGEPFAEFLDCLLQKDIADPARRAIAAALMHEERHVVVDDLKNVPLTVKDDDRARGRQIVECELSVKLSRAIMAPLGPPT
jgi:hypothetical protein